MAKKRKIAANSLPPSQPEPPPHQPVKVEEDPEEEEEAEYEEVEYEEELEEEEEEDGEEDAEGQSDEEDDGEDEDLLDAPSRSLLDSFSKEALISLLLEAAENYPQVAVRILESAEADPSQRKIFVHGLKWDTTSEILSEEFVKYGEIENCRVIPDKTTGKSKGYGFVIYKSIRGALQALKEPQKLIGGRMTSCQLASVGNFQTQIPSSQEPGMCESEHTQKKIYVSNVGAELDPKRLTAFFSRYGEIEEGPLGLDKETGKPRGFCLYVYKTVESAKMALAEPHKQFEGVTLHCQKAIDGPKLHKKQMIQMQMPQNIQSQQFTNNLAPSFAGSSSTVVPAVIPGNLMAPPPLQQHHQGLSLNPAALGQALTTLIAAQGSGLNLLGAFGSVGPGAGLVNNPVVMPSLGSQLVQGGYGNQATGNIGLSGYRNQAAGNIGLSGSSKKLNGRGRGGRSQRGGRAYMGR
ncbi:UBP1-associated protein 2A-like isoform X2 [Henckelia pumila]|uniref:UBP1-associated protein 2A-like isoform X2 n=1 Tax=Henckelia pumila TaxID=405737 RepID=UPI003C6DF6A4